MYAKTIQYTFNTFLPIFLTINVPERFKNEQRSGRPFTLFALIKLYKIRHEQNSATT